MESKYFSQQSEALNNLPIEVEPSHHNHTVDTNLPLLRKHAPSVSPERMSSNFLFPIFLRLEKLFTFRKEDPNNSYPNRKSGTDPEYFLQ